MILFSLSQCSKEKPQNSTENPKNYTGMKVRDLKGDYSEEGAKEITLDGLSKENIKVFPKKDLFGKHSKIFDCNESGCGSEEVSKEQKKKLSKCTYEGKLKDDPDSRVNLIMCDPKGSQNLVILSDKKNMGSNVYRVDSNGKFKGIPEQNFTDEVDEKVIAKYERKGSDYELEMDKSITAAAVKMNGKYYAILVEDEGPKCCKIVRTHCKKKDGSNACTEEKRHLCDGDKPGQTCEKVKKYVKKQGKKGKGREKEERER